jgi:clan AA aspartic protease (TIGR02281 family)
VTLNHAKPAFLLRPQVMDGREIVASGSWGKGCYVEARSNGQLFRMLLDTGASGMLTFGRNHAEQLGLEPLKLNFDHSYGSANGEGRYASIRLREFRLDTLIIRDVEADITQAPQSVPLLGVELLHRLHLHLKDGNCIITVPRA